MRNSFTGFIEHVFTFRCEGVVEPGMLVTMYSSETVRQASKYEPFIGKVITVDSGFAVVQLSGYVECETVNEITVGRNRLVSDGYDSVSVSDSYSGSDVWVVLCEETEDGYIVGFLL